MGGRAYAIIKFFFFGKITLQRRNLKDTTLFNWSKLVSLVMSISNIMSRCNALKKGTVSLL